MAGRRALPILRRRNDGIQRKSRRPIITVPPFSGYLCRVWCAHSTGSYVRTNERGNFRKCRVAVCEYLILSEITSEKNGKASLLASLLEVEPQERSIFLISDLSFLKVKSGIRYLVSTTFEFADILYGRFKNTI